MHGGTHGFEGPTDSVAIRWLELFGMAGSADPIHTEIGVESEDCTMPLLLSQSHQGRVGKIHG